MTKIATKGTCNIIDFFFGIWREKIVKNEQRFIFK